MGNTRAGCVAARVLEATPILLEHPVGKYRAFLRRTSLPNSQRLGVARNA
jgi:hypothetical protein